MQKTWDGKPYGIMAVSKTAYRGSIPLGRVASKGVVYG